LVSDDGLARLPFRSFEFVNCTIGELVNTEKAPLYVDFIFAADCHALDVQSSILF
jgi:hypothetical protein